MFKLEFDREHLWQWDLKQRLILTNEDVGTQVHFSSPFIETNGAPPVYTYLENDTLYADIPDEFLQMHGYFLAYVYTCSDSERGEAHTKKQISVEVKERERPSDYVYEKSEYSSYVVLSEQLKEKITSPLTAKVGQSIVVKSVDESGRPIEWECVDSVASTSPITFEVEGEEEIIETQIILTHDGNGNVSIETEGIEVTNDGLGNISLTSDDLVVEHDGTGNVSINVK